MGSTPMGSTQNFSSELPVSLTKAIWKPAVLSSFRFQVILTSNLKLYQILQVNRYKVKHTTQKKVESFFSIANLFCLLSYSLV